MEAVVFVIKCLIVTVVLVVVLQIQVGSHTIEGHAMNWIHHSSISHNLQDVAEGAAKIANKGKAAVVGFVGSSGPLEEKSTEASTGGWFKIKRSTAYYRQKERERTAREKSSEKLSEDDRVSSADATNSDQD